MGRRRAIRADVIREICRYLEGGATVETACVLAGISEQTYYTYQELAEVVAQEQDLTGRRLTARERQAVTFMEEVARAQARLKVALSVGILSAGRGQQRIDPVYETDEETGERRLVKAGQDGRQGDWRALAHLAAVRFPREFAPRHRIEHTSPEGEGIQVYTLGVPLPPHMQQQKPGGGPSGQALLPPAP